MFSKTVLIIDDDEGIRETVRMALEFEGYATRTAQNGREALEAIEGALQPDIIVVDLMMPVMNGWEFITVIKGNPKLSTIPIVVVSAFTDKLRGVPVQSVLHKPISLNDLLSVIRKHSS